MSTLLIVILFVWTVIGGLFGLLYNDELYRKPLVCDIIVYLLCGPMLWLLLTIGLIVNLCEYLPDISDIVGWVGKNCPFQKKDK